jgi:predicted N-acetyltransferase YhbS
MSKPTTTSESGAEPSASSERDGRGHDPTISEITESHTVISRNEYVVRPYRAGDRDRVLTLYESVFGEARTGEWFDWRYDGPFGDGVQMFVAERDGELVAAEPFVALPMRAGDERTLALQPVDAMVAPEHRRNGLLTRMTERALKQYADADPAFVFNFPTEATKNVYLKLGWVDVGTVATAYRIQNPSTFLDSTGEEAGVDALAGSAVDAGAAAFNRIADAVSSATTTVDDSVTVQRHEGVPASSLETLYEFAEPARLHVPCTETFYDWRVGNPNWNVRTYTAHRGDAPVAAVVTAADPSEEPTITRLLDALPLLGQTGRTDAFAALMAAVVEDNRDADALSVSEDTLPDSVLSQFGFLRDDRGPLSMVSSPTTAVARPIDRDRFADWTVGGCHLSERRDWRLPLIGQDCST